MQEGAEYNEALTISTRGVRLQGYGGRGERIIALEEALLIAIEASDDHRRCLVLRGKGASRVNRSLRMSDTSTVEVLANEGWQSSGVTLMPGLGIPSYVSASGAWSMGLGSVGPEGDVDGVIAPETYPCPGLPSYALVARVGGGACQLVGAGAELDLSGGGLVELRMNDNASEDNTGSVSVEVSRCRVQNMIETSSSKTLDRACSRSRPSRAGTKGLTIRGSTSITSATAPRDPTPRLMASG